MRVQTRTVNEHFCIFSFVLSVTTTGLGFEVNDMLNHLRRLTKTKAKEIRSWKERKRSAVKCGLAAEKNTAEEEEKCGVTVEEKKNTAEEEEKVAPLKCDWRLLPN
ncbi:hypothetical protein GOBAR_DD19061 [Gossypium barbadense]|nr:hypothetical protein GOBAR_DD19061 [Gossypium barbadense]